MDRPTCRICGTTESLLRCAKCKTVHYCSTTHQHMDWSNHKPECRRLAKQKLHQQQQNNNRLNQISTNNIIGGVVGGGSGIGGIGGGVIGIGSGPHMLEIAGAGDYNNWGGLFNGGGFVDNGVGSGNFGDITAREANNILADVDTLSLVLGTSEAEIMNSRAEIVSQSQHSSNILYNSTIPKRWESSGGRIGGGDSGGIGVVVSGGSGGGDNSSTYHIGRGDENYIVHPNMGANTNERNEELCRNIINDMNTYGLSVVDDFLGMEKGLSIFNEVQGMYAAGVFKDGQLVSSNQMAEQDLRTIRGDKITWVTGVEPGCANVGYLINQIDAVITRANTMKNNGKLGNYTIRERTKAMVACYPGSGAHYVMHVDNPNRDGRVITAIYYLNVNWDTKRSGGVLKIFPEHNGSVAEIEPKFDRLIFFWSDKRNPHEVQPAHRTRYAITVWYFDADEREAALNRCKQFRNKTLSNNTTTHNTNNANNTNNTITTTAATTTTTSSSSSSSSPSSSSTNSNTNPNSNSSDICT